ncbi:MAG: glycoside hydrolase family 2 TIM barrel-domain containing protein [Clostridia bacterium]|nr:glycoside hydrolase family 2 TIM barrel-domain containing protein [Clostridia bacterium]
MKNYVENYPRPQLIRDSFILLDGEWDFAFDENSSGESNSWYTGFSTNKTIRVPFTYETKASGIDVQKVYDCVWYQRNVALDREDGKRVIINFEGSDYETKVWVNGKVAGTHRGGYSRFGFDITDLIVDGENLITVSCKDSLDKAQPRGKQRWVRKSHDCWYVQTTGIWKSVWIEYVPEVYVASLKLTPDVDNSLIKIEGTLNRESNCLVAAEISFDGDFVSAGSASMTGDRRFSFTVNVANRKYPWWVMKWTPESPDLYDLTIKLLDEENEIIDEVKSYFGMRDIRISGENVLLNGVPLYQKLILDQGYWEESHLTPPSEQALIDDIDKIMALGYNGVRKHMKVEDERFLYWADVKGLLVWSEFPATYEFTDDALENFTDEWMEVVRQNYSHPSVITWTPFNESWGVFQIKHDKAQQDFTQAIYYLTKSFDKMRPVICNDGWEHTISDIITLHDYEEDTVAFSDRYADKYALLENETAFSKRMFAMADGFEYKGQPVIISEFGGIAVDGQGNGWGYGNKVTNEEDFLDRFGRITDAIKGIPYCCGYCYTQVSDVQQEVNGLLFENHEFKFSPEKIKEINDR